jgi:uncharacterized repeat protein (TIGR03847 family)
MSESFRFESPDLFTAGTTGPKGQRVFYLQFGDVGSLVTIKLEKGQVHALAEYLDQLLDDAGRVPRDQVPLALDLIEPVRASWTVSSIGVGFDEAEGHFLLVAEELMADDDDSEPATAEVTLSTGQVQAFVERARDLVNAGRPPCSYCGRPLDSDDGWCPCFN